MGLFDRLRGKKEESTARLTLVIDSEGDHFATDEPTWPQLAQAVEPISPASSPVLIRDDGSQIRADGARARFTIIYRASGDAAPLVIGRSAGAKRRGRLEVQDDLVRVTPLEW